MRTRLVGWESVSNLHCMHSQYPKLNQNRCTTSDKSRTFSILAGDLCGLFFPQELQIKAVGSNYFATLSAHWVLVHKRKNGKRNPSQCRRVRPEYAEDFIVVVTRLPRSEPTMSIIITQMLQNDSVRPRSAVQLSQCAERLLLSEQPSSVVSTIRFRSLQSARQRAQENEAWRCVRKHAILQQLHHGEAVSVPAIVLQPSFCESQERWITLQFLAILHLADDPRRACNSSLPSISGTSMSARWTFQL